MSQPLLYVDQSHVETGKLALLRAAIDELAAFVEENEPGLVSYSVYFNRDCSRMSVAHIHADSASLDNHLEVAGQQFAKFAGLVRLEAIDIYGEPSETARDRLREKLRLLGTGDVTVHAPRAGFLRTTVGFGRAS